MENNTDFYFYLKFTKPLILNLPQINDRVLAAAWVRKLVESTADEKIKLDYLKLLLFFLQRKKLAAPFTEHPNNVEELSNFSAGHSLVEVAKLIIEKENIDKREKARKRLQGQFGDFPPYFSDFSADLLEYVAVQYIDDFGVHGYYAVSKQPLNQWHRIDKQLLPKAAKSMIEVSAGPATLTGVLSSSQLTKVQTERSSQIEKPKKEIPEEPTESAEILPSPPKKKERPERSTLGASPPARIIGKTPLPEDREPPTWGSNLLEVKHVLEYGDDAGNLFAASSPTEGATTEVLWTSDAGLPMYDNFDDWMGQSPPTLMDRSLADEAGSSVSSFSRFACSSATSLPYLTPQYSPLTPPPSGKPTPSLFGPPLAPSLVSSLTAPLPLLVAMRPSKRPFPQAKPTRSSLFLHLMDRSPPSFMKMSLADETDSPVSSPSRFAWSFGASLPYLTPQYPTVTSPPPRKPTPPFGPPFAPSPAPPLVAMRFKKRPFAQARPTRALLLLQKKKAQQQAPPPSPPVRISAVRTSVPKDASERSSKSRYSAFSAASKRAPSSRPIKSSLPTSSTGSKEVPSRPSKSSLSVSSTTSRGVPSRSSKSNLSVLSTRSIEVPSRPSKSNLPVSSSGPREVSLRPSKSNLPALSTESVGVPSRLGKLSLPVLPTGSRGVPTRPSKSSLPALSTESREIPARLSELSFPASSTEPREVSSRPSKLSLPVSSTESRGVPSRPSKLSLPGLSPEFREVPSRPSKLSVPRPSASKESALRKTGAVARTSRRKAAEAYSPPASTADAFRGFADNDDDGEVNTHLEKYNKMLSDIEAQYIHDVAEYAKLWPAKKNSRSKTKPARHPFA